MSQNTIPDRVSGTRTSRSVAVIGAGNWGGNIVRTLHELGALACILETDQARRKTLAGEYPGTPILSEFADLLKLGSTAVAIATPAAFHHHSVREALMAGLDVFVEKPFTLDVAEAEELVTLADARSRILMVGHLLLYHPAIRWIRDFIVRGELGKLYGFSQERLGLGRVRQVENALWSLGVHDLAVLLYLIGHLPLKIHAAGSVWLQEGIEDEVHLQLVFPEGITAHMHCSWYWPERSRKLTIQGEQGMLVFDEMRQEVSLHHKRVDDDLKIVDEGQEVVFRAEGEPLRLELQHFLECVVTRQRPLSDGRQGVEVVRALTEASRLLTFGRIPVRGKVARNE